MAIVEAASCGLQVVSTKVGGIPEVLPSTLIKLTNPDTNSLIEAIEQSILQKNRYLSKKGQYLEVEFRIITQTLFFSFLFLPDSTLNMCPFGVNNVVANLYNWENVTERTEKVYHKVIQEPTKSLQTIMNNVLRSDVYLYLLVVSLSVLILKFLGWYHPEENIDLCYKFKAQSKRKNKRD